MWKYRSVQEKSPYQLIDRSQEVNLLGQYVYVGL